jgi:hypothetical protein
MAEPKPSQFVDISQWPPNEKAHIVEMARKHNALSLDVDGISGITPEEKQQFHGLMGNVRRLFARLHGKRFHVLLGLATFHYALSTMKQLGLSPEQASRLVEAAIKILEKLAL